MSEARRNLAFGKRIRAARLRREGKVSEADRLEAEAAELEAIINAATTGEDG